MAVEDLYQTTIYMRSEGGVFTVGLAWEQNDGVTLFTTMTALAQHIVDDILPLLQDVLAVDVEVDQVHCAAVTSPIDLAGFVNLEGEAGTRLGKALPNNLAVCLKQVTLAPNARHNGRIFFGGCSESDFIDGVMTAALVTAFGLLIAELMEPVALTGIEDAVFQPCVISRHNNNLPRLDPVPFRYDTLSVDVNVRQQRRRGTKRLGLSA